MRELLFIMSLGFSGKANSGRELEPGELSVNGSPFYLREMGRGLAYETSDYSRSRSFLFYTVFSERRSGKEGNLSQNSKRRLCFFMEEKKNAEPSAERQLTDKELEELLKKSENVTEFPEVTFDEFTPPTHEEWVDACNALLKGQPFDKVMFTKTYEGITFQPMYTRKDTDGILPKDNYPGMGDFLRGSTANGYVRHPWGIAQSCDETLPSENNELLKHEVSHGSTVYNIRTDSATMENRDVQDAEKPGDEGVSLTTLDDMHVLLDGLDLTKYPVMMYGGPSSAALLALTAAALKAKGKAIKEVTGVIGANPVGQLIKKGQSIAGLDQLYDEMADCILWTRANAPHLRTVMVRSDVFSRGGAEDVQEVAYTFGMAVEYIRQMLKRNISIHDIAQSFYFGFNQGANFFMEISKLRAARQVWSNIMEAFGAEEEDRAMLIHGRPALFTKTVFDPYVNMLRNTTQTFSSVVGGVTTYENEPFDEPIRKGDTFSRRIARNVQVMLQEEFGLLRPVDPAGGSWAVESLTKKLTEKIWAEFQKIEGMGGIIKALEDGYPQQSIADVVEKRFKSLELRKDRAVGTNMYPNMTEELLDTRPEDTETLKKQRIHDVEAYRADIDQKFLEEKLDQLKKASGSEKIEAAVEAFSAGATIGEIRQALGRGQSETMPVIEPHRWTERFEQMRMDTEKFKADTGKNVEIFLANMGPIPQHKARADFSTSFLQVGEFNVHMNDGFQDGEDGTAIEKCVKAASEFPYDVAVICSTDKTYPDIVPELTPKLKKALPEGAVVFLAGAAPKDLKEKYDAAGVDDYVSVKANCYEILRMLQKKKGMIE